MPEDELSKSFENAQGSLKKNFQEMGLPSRQTTEDKPKKQKQPFRWFPNAPEQMKKWFNTTSGFICGVFGGFFMVTLSAAVITAVVGGIGFAAFATIFYFVSNYNLDRCVKEWETEKNYEAPPGIIQDCREMVGLERTDEGKKDGYW